MLNLLKADLYRVLKDKLFKVAIILCVILAIVIPLGYYGINVLVNEITINTFASNSTPEEIAHYREELYSSILSAYVFTKMLTAPAMPFSIVLGVFVAILLGKDRETCRNKIIVGHSRKNIYFSNILLSLIVYVGFMFLYTLLTYLVSAIVLKREFGTSAGYVFAGIGLRLLGLICVGLGVSFTTSAFHGNALPIVLHILVNYLCMTLGVLLASFALVGVSGDVNTGLKVLSGINVPFSFIGIMGDYSWQSVLPFVLTSTVFSTLFIAIGYLIFRHKKLK